jgi:hypothetical protein
MKFQVFNKKNFLLYGGIIIIGFTVIILIFILLHNKKQTTIPQPPPQQPQPPQTPEPIKPKSCYLSSNPDPCKINNNTENQCTTRGCKWNNTSCSTDCASLLQNECNNNKDCTFGIPPPNKSCYLNVENDPCSKGDNTGGFCSIPCKWDGTILSEIGNCYTNCNSLTNESSCNNNNSCNWSVPPCFLTDPNNTQYPVAYCNQFNTKDTCMPIDPNAKKNLGPCTWSLNKDI